MSYQPEKQLALKIVKQAAKLCQRVQQTQGRKAVQKADTSPVTVADFGAQAILCQGLMEAFPNDPVIGEEDATLLQQPELEGVRRQIIEQVQHSIPAATPEKVIDWINWGNGKVAQRYWTLDPIDGTKGFIRGDQYAVALALVEEGEVKLGVLACPAFPREDNGKGVIFLAIRGQGAVEMPLDGETAQQIKVDPSSNFEQLYRIESVESVHSDRQVQTAIDQRLGLTSIAKQMDSLAKYGAIARGDAHVYTRVPLPQFEGKKENIWDHAAGVIIVEEAGGRVTDLDGKPLDFSVGAKLSNNRGVLATNSVIHSQVLAAIQQEQ
ncbi:3(2),5 -bisphosphate nucleotidase HAL2 [Crocosphaera subtropica ATCC 51142]|uniref:3(2),5-bisphosphate nucleotidase HAL2 n=1 Tax=Crocosphaera subtropica (strain ATCC 51142 / BH68) TaxID=43989 RepID=B1WUB7_CROS5|nr:3'(2'),5'-bisphosphate nucleotidase [Crocosphaera subtropica]ACB53771.1 3(2),5 -bisphosphate nucleotidase HAL2 [Crocosphaera subtropica ATCC 51142]